MPNVPAARLTALIHEIFGRSGSHAEEAEWIAQHLVTANLVGHDSHGALRVRDYLQWLRAGMVVPNQQLATVMETECVLVADGQRGYGQAIGVSAVQRGVDLCRRSGVAVVALRNTAHLGRIGHWAELAAAEQVVSLHFVSTSGFGLLVAPFGGIDRRLSANPLTIGFPRGDASPLILDMSTCAIAEGKIKVARNAGTPVPAGCLVDADGEPTTDPERFYADPPGSILPIAGHKGFGLSVCVELLAGALTGNGCSHHRREQLEQGMLSIYIDPERLNGRGHFNRELEALVTFIKGSRCATPAGEILMPGELEARTRSARLADGIPLDDTTWNQLVEAAVQQGVPADGYRIE